ncbi:MAG: hypothetical protein DRJ65_11500 [Acidobacteria bacterium]|nr:MAG: hypothetical protein DRJ65_11500 [Acidobacteriota bacterium]
MRYSISILCFLIFLTPSLGQPGQSDVVIHDTFNDDTVGQAPGSPDIGSSFYWGSGTHTVISDYGSQSLRSVDSSSTEGYAVQWLPTSTPAVFEASYLFRMESFSGGAAVPIAYQRFYVTTDTTVEAVRLYWKPNGSLELLASTPATPTFSWVTGVTYQVRLRVNCTDDITSLWVGGTALVTNKSLGFDCNAMVDFSDGTDFTLLSTRSLDDVKVVAVVPLFVDGFESGDSSMWSETMPPVSGPSGDHCLSAISLTEGTFLGNLLDNTDSGFSDTCGTSNGIDEWVSYTAPCDGTVDVTTCHPETVFDSTLSVWDDATCSGGMLEVACNDDANGAPPECDLNGANRKSLASFTASAGTTYVFRVTAYADGIGFGGYGISAQCTP